MCCVRMDVAEADAYSSGSGCLEHVELFARGAAEGRLGAGCGAGQNTSWPVLPIGFDLLQRNTTGMDRLSQEPTAGTERSMQRWSV